MDEDWINEAMEEFEEADVLGMAAYLDHTVRELLLDAYERGYQDGRRSRYFDDD